MDDQHWMDLAEEAGQLREAMRTRAPIEQAKGMIAVLRGCDVTEAYAELRRASNDHNVKLNDLASALVAVVGGQGTVDEGLEQAVHVARSVWGGRASSTFDSEFGSGSSSAADDESGSGRSR